MIPYLNSRESQLCQEFAFFPTAPPHTEGGIFELRKYQLKPGALLEWEQAWYVSPGGDVAQSFIVRSFVGERVLRPVDSMLSLLAHGSRRSADFIRSTTCGNTRTSNLHFPERARD